MSDIDKMVDEVFGRGFGQFGRRQQVPACPKGFVWCPNTKKCIPEEQQRSGGRGRGMGVGQGKGPIGVPRREEQTAELIDKTVDEVFDGGFDQFGKVRQAEKKIDFILDACSKVREDADEEEAFDLGKGTINTTGRPYDHPIKSRIEVGECMGPMMNEEGDNEFVDSEYDGGPEQSDDPRKKSNKINQVPNQDALTLLKSIQAELVESKIWKAIAQMRISEDYKSYFKSMLKKHGYNSPANIPADKKKEFFNAVDKGWKGTNEKD